MLRQSKKNNYFVWTAWPWRLRSCSPPKHRGTTYPPTHSHIPENLNTLPRLTDVSHQLLCISLSFFVLCKKLMELICDVSHFIHPHTVIANLISGLYWNLVLMIETKCYRDIVILTRSDQLWNKLYLNPYHIYQIIGNESHHTKHSYEDKQHIQLKISFWTSRYGVYL
jgi:hypothetical protein